MTAPVSVRRNAAFTSLDHLNECVCLCFVQIVKRVCAAVAAGARSQRGMFATQAEVDRRGMEHIKEEIRSQEMYLGFIVEKVHCHYLSQSWDAIELHQAVQAMYVAVAPYLSDQTERPAMTVHPRLQLIYLLSESFRVGSLLLRSNDPDATAAHLETAKLPRSIVDLFSENLAPWCSTWTLDENRDFITMMSEMIISLQDIQQGIQKFNIFAEKCGLGRVPTSRLDREFSLAILLCEGELRRLKYVTRMSGMSSLMDHEPSNFHEPTNCPSISSSPQTLGGPLGFQSSSIRVEAPCRRRSDNVGDVSQAICAVHELAAC